MKPPRYRLREFMVLRLMRDLPGIRFLELGFGQGEMLVTLARHGYQGIGYDSSAEAFNRAQQLLKEQQIATVSVSTQLPEGQVFDHLLFFEVIGYLEDPITWLNEMKKTIAESGDVIFSFTNKRHCGDAERLSGGMTCFTRHEVTEILRQAGFKPRQIVNYGYPLTNCLRPLLHWLHRRRESATHNSYDERAIANSGFGGLHGRLAGLSSLLYPALVFPFSYLQLVFKNTNLGTGFVVVASPDGQTPEKK